jgi:DNA replication licensing factor MCM4
MWILRPTGCTTSRNTRCVSIIFHSLTAVESNSRCAASNLDAVPDGQTPHTVSLCLYDEYVDLVKPGDRICLTGIFLSVPIRINPRQRVIKSLFKTYLDVVHVKKTDAKRMGVDGSTRQGDTRRGVVGVGGEEGLEEEGMQMDYREGEERARTSKIEFEESLVELSTRKDIYEHLARSLAPSIWEMDDIKKGILLQLFGGTNKTIARGGGGGGPRYRGDINVLLVGDPGTSKSQILQVS